MPSQRELPRDFQPKIGANGEGLSDTEPSGARTWVFLGHSEYRPTNEYDALMRCAAHEEPESSREERLVLREPISDAIDSLTEEERWIFDALFVRRASLRELAREIAVPKTTVARRRDALLVTLREKLQSDPFVVEYLEAQ